MAVEFITWAFGLRISATEKLVLVALADWADAEGFCFAHAVRIAEKTSLTDRCVRATLKRLEAAGQLRRGAYDHRPGWILNRNDIPKNRNDVPIEKPEPRSAIPERRSEEAEPRSGPSYTSVHVNEPSEPPLFPHEVLALKAPENRQAKKPKTRKTRLPDDWQLSPKGREYATRLGLNADAEVEKFRAYHIGQATEWASWDHSWQYWCRRAVGQPGNNAAARGRTPGDGVIASANRVLAIMERNEHLRGR